MCNGGDSTPSITTKKQAALSHYNSLYNTKLHKSIQIFRHPFPFVRSANHFVTLSPRVKAAPPGDYQAKLHRVYTQTPDEAVSPAQAALIKPNKTKRPGITRPQSLQDSRRVRSHIAPPVPSLSSQAYIQAATK